MPPRITAPDGCPLAYDLVESPSSMATPPVLLLHGFAGSSEANWVRTGVVDALHAAGRPALLTDARGHGHSGRPHDPAAYRSRRLIDDVALLLDTLALPDVDVVGYSMGAFTAARLVPHRRVRSVVLAGVGDDVLRPRPAESRATIADALLAAPGSRVADPLARLLRRYAEIVGADREALAAAQTGATFGEPATVVTAGLPTLVLAGDRDRTVGDPAALARAIPGAALTLVPGHHISAPSAPEFAAAVTAFLVGVDRRSPAA